MQELLNEIDELLAHFEDFTHGKDGEDITKMRGRIALALRQYNVSVSLPMVEQPILIGHLNKIFGYNGFNKIEIGTPVYSFKDRYYFEMTPVNGGKVVIQKFYKDTLTPCIDFVSNNR